MIKEKELPKAVVNNKLITHKATDLTIMSYDKNVHKLIIPTDLTQDQISDIIVLITFRYHDNIIQISGDLVDDKIEIILPNEIRRLSGEFYIEIDINLTDNRQITFARYRANVVKSDIDSVDLDDAQEFYFELFDDFVQKVADKSEIAVSEIDAHKQKVSDKADTAIAVITDASNSVTTAKQSALTSITQATSEFTADLADTQSTIDAQIAQVNLDLADDLAEVDNAIANINAKNTQVDTLHSDFTTDVATKQADVTSKYNVFDTSVNDTADGFMADVAEKSQLVDDKYQQFDDDVAAANGNLDAILGLVENVEVRLKNEIVNGDFSQGLDNWLLSSQMDVNVENNTIVGTVTAAGTSKSIRQLMPKAETGDKLYTTFIMARVKTGMEIYWNGKATVSSEYQNVGNFERQSFVLLTTNGNNVDRNLYFYVSVGNSNHGDYLKLKEVVTINLTQTFGAGNEPTKSEMDALIHILGGWFDGEITLTQMQQLNWLLKLIRQNALATTALGGTML